MTHPNFKAAVMAMIDTVDDTGFDSQSVEFWETALLAALQKLDAPSPNPLPTTEGVTQGWQDIATAPKDGTTVDLWLVDQDGASRRVTNAYWAESMTEDAIEYGDGFYTAATRTRSGWLAPNQDHDLTGFCDEPRWWDANPRRPRWRYIRPTHWMPLPPPPGQ